MIDWKRVEELHFEIGADDFREVVELFFSEVEGVLVRISSASDRALLREDLHFLKGSAVNLGFAAFGALCQAGERMAAAGNPVAVDLGALQVGYDHSKEQFMEKTGPGLSGRAALAGQ